MGNKPLQKQPQELDAYIRAELFDNGAICPVCGAGSIIAGTVAGEQYGVCMCCYNRALERAIKAKARDDESHRTSYANARQVASRAKISLRGFGITSDDLEMERWEG